VASVLHLPFSRQRDTVTAMQLLTPKQYRVLKGMSRQSFHQKVKRGTLLLVKKKMIREESLVPVDDTELEGVNLDTLTE
jgi:hypothetical protein